MPVSSCAGNGRTYLGRSKDQQRAYPLLPPPVGEGSLRMPLTRHTKSDSISGKQWFDTPGRNGSVKRVTQTPNTSYSKSRNRARFERPKCTYSVFWFEFV